MGEKAYQYKKKIGFVMLTLDAKGKWYARFYHPKTNKDIRRVLRVTTEEEAIDAAMVLNKSILDEKVLSQAINHPPHVIHSRLRMP